MVSSWYSNFLSCHTSSASSSATYLPEARLRPVFRATDTPAWSISTSVNGRDPRFSISLTTSGPLSVEPSLTTMHSYTEWVWAATDSSVSRIQVPALNMGITTDTRGAPTDLRLTQPPTYANQVPPTMEVHRRTPPSQDLHAPAKHTPHPY